MKHLLNPQYQIGGGLILFVIMLINSLMNDASSWEDLSWWGKAAMVPFLILMGYWLVRMIISVGMWIKNLF